MAINVSRKTPGPERNTYQLPSDANSCRSREPGQSIDFVGLECDLLYISMAGTLGCVFIDNETHESGVTKCTTGEAWSAFI